VREEFAADFIDCGLWEKPRLGPGRRPLLEPAESRGVLRDWSEKI